MSENKKYFYLKLKDSFFSSEEMLMLESLPDGMIYQNIYLRMCLLSLKNEGALTFKNMIPYNLNMLSTVLHIDVAKMKMALELFEKLKLITKTDNETLYMSDIQALIGRSSTEAERIANYRKRITESNNVTEMLPDEKRTKSVQMLQSCTPELKTEKEKELEQEQEGACILTNDNISEPEKVTLLVNQIFEKIQKHNNSQPKHKIPISKDIFTFQCKEGREIIQLCKQDTAENILKAIENYLTVANMESWRNSFTFVSFCKNLAEFTDDFFDIEKYKINKPQSTSTIVQKEQYTDEEYKNDEMQNIENIPY